MKSLFTKSLPLICTVVPVFAAFNLGSQVLGTYEFTGSGVCPHANNTVSMQPANAVFSAFNSANTTCTASNDVYNNKAWNTAPNIDPEEYNEFRIIPEACFRLNLVSLSFDHKLSTGTANWYVRSSADNFTADLLTGVSTVSQENANLTLPVDFESLDSVIFRFYVTGILAGTTTWRQDNVIVSGTVNSFAPVNYYPDNDADGFGAGTGILLCSNPGGYALNPDDCDDLNNEVNPGSVWYADADNDGYGDNDVSETGCTSALVNATLQGNDCDDDNNLVNPETIWFEDADLDGFGDENTTEMTCVSAFSNPVMTGGDCNDSESSVYPGATEICDGLDNDCDNSIDEGFTATTYYADNDHDGFGAGNSSEYCSDPGTGFSLNNGDCNDNDETINPGATDISGNSVDENCDGTDGVLGVEQSVMENFKLFPNPGNESITIIFSAAGKGKISLYTVSGVLLQTLDIGPDLKEFTLDTRSLSSGIYLVKMEMISGTKSVRWTKD